MFVNRLRQLTLVELACYVADVGQVKLYVSLLNSQFGEVTLVDEADEVFARAKVASDMVEQAAFSKVTALHPVRSSSQPNANQFGVGKPQGFQGTAIGSLRSHWDHVSFVDQDYRRVQNLMGDVGKRLNTSHDDSTG
ncbi:hypothetical protein D3C79_702340 [compost metagenome]